LAGCDGGAFWPAQPTSSAPARSALPAPPPGGAREGEVVAPSAESAAMREYLARVGRALEAQGLLRQDVAPRDAPFGARQLAEDFIRIALYDEYAARGGGFVAEQQASRLRRWTKPVRMSVEFGASVPLAQRRADRNAISAYAGQLRRASGHPVSFGSGPGNFTVLMLNEDERRAAGPRLRQLVPGIDEASVSAITGLAPSTFCVAFAFSSGNSPEYDRVVAVIRGEHPDRLRLSCIHEELAQGMGLANDSPRARPSIFNDDEEFALLTRHDELLLRMLYDPRLTPGMTEAEARPIVQTIAAELMGGES
jgi:hypothetical protein